MAGAIKTGAWVAMNIHMYANPILQENIRKLRRLGYHFMEPAEGYLACGYEGKGRLPEPERIVEEIRRLLKKKDLVGEKLLITAGPNREPLDPVRYLSNRSSGKWGMRSRARDFEEERRYFSLAVRPSLRLLRGLV